MKLRNFILCAALASVMTFCASAAEIEKIATINLEGGQWDSSERISIKSALSTSDNGDYVKVSYNYNNDYRWMVIDKNGSPILTDDDYNHVFIDTIDGKTVFLVQKASGDTYSLIDENLVTIIPSGKYRTIAIWDNYIVCTRDENNTSYVDLFDSMGNVVAQNLKGEYMAEIYPDIEQCVLTLGDNILGVKFDGTVVWELKQHTRSSSYGSYTNNTEHYWCINQLSNNKKCIVDLLTGKKLFEVPNDIKYIGEAVDIGFVISGEKNDLRDCYVVDYSGKKIFPTFSTDLNWSITPTMTDNLLAYTFDENNSFICGYLLNSDFEIIHQTSGGIYQELSAGLYGVWKPDTYEGLIINMAGDVVYDDLSDGFTGFIENDLYKDSPTPIMTQYTKFNNNLPDASSSAFEIRDNSGKVLLDMDDFGGYLGGISQYEWIITPEQVVYLYDQNNTIHIYKINDLQFDPYYAELMGIEQKPEPKPEKIFDDVPKDSWFADAVAYAYENGFMYGTSETTFSPYESITKGAVTTILARIDGVDTTTGENWYDVGQQWAEENEIATNSNPLGTISREEFIVMFYRYAEMKGKDVSGKGDLTVFSDYNNISAEATDAMAWAVDAKIMQGSNGALLPDGVANRCEMAALFQRFNNWIAQ